ncbi:MAG: PAS domain-containing protein [bacterium]
MNGKHASIDTADPADFLSGGGEMGALIRSMDWSGTPLGPISEWSQALRATVGMMLRARFPFILWWGPQFIQLYNDPYRPVPGDKHPKSMGQPASECWEEIWHIIGPMIEAPFSGKPATWSDDLLLIINRKGFMEETHYKVSYSPIPDPAVQPTGVGGVLATVAETTGQVYAERQLRTLRELGARASEAKTSEQACQAAAETFMTNSQDIPFALFYLLDSQGKQVHLAADCGFEAHGAANPEHMILEENRPWPLSPVVEHGELEFISNLPERFTHLPTGGWSQPPHSAMALPLSVPDQPQIYGVLIAGLSPHREMNESYRTFFELAAGQVTTAIRNARAFQEERKRAEALAEAHALTETLLTQAPVGFVYFDRDLRYVLINDRLAEINGLPAEAHLGQRVHDIVPSLAPTAEKIAARILATNRPIKDQEFSGETALAPGVTRYWSESWYPVHDDRGAVVGFGAVVEEITERKRTEQALFENEQKLRAFTEAMPAILWTTDTDYRYTLSVGLGLTALGLRQHEVEGKTIFEIMQTEDPDYPALAATRQALTGKAASYEIDYHGRLFKADILPLRDEEGKVIGTVGATIDITERKQAEELLAAAHRQIQSIIDNTPAIVYAFDLEERFVMANATVAELLNSTPEQMIGKRRHEFMPKEDADWHEANDQQVIEAGRALEFEEYSQIEGRSITWLTTKFPLRDAQGRIYAVAGISADITGRKAAEDQIKNSLREKEVLLKEIHHRVKNNLQIIYSMLDLQLLNVKDKQAIDIFKESQNRIYTMALIHEKLYQSKSLARVDLAEYIQSLISNLFLSYGVSERIVRPVIHVEDVPLGVDRVIPCALIMNELVSNSLKYAFPDSRQRADGMGEIHITLQKTKDNTLVLTVSDNGAGLPKGLEIEKCESLGLKLVNVLVKQLKGTLQLGRPGTGNGTECIITFKATE